MLRPLVELEVWHWPERRARKVRDAYALADLPLLHASFGKGEISYSKVRAMSRVATPANEDCLLMIAKHGTDAHFIKAIERATAELQARKNGGESVVAVKLRSGDEGRCYRVRPDPGG